MQWHQLTDMSQLSQIIDISKQQPGKYRAVVIFKHSVRCSISSMALNRVESKWKDDETIPMYYLDLINHRDVSNEIATFFGVEHASPQVLVICDGKCIYHASHNGIIASDILEVITK